MRRLVTIAVALLLSSSAFAQDAYHINRFRSQIIPGFYPSDTWAEPFFFPFALPAPVFVQPVPVGPPPPSVACAAVTWGAPLNLRTWPNGPLIATYLAGTRVVIDGSNGGNWVHTVVGPATGWMFAPYLTPIPCGY